MAKNKGGRLEAKVVSVDKSGFTIKIHAPGNSDHEDTVDLPLKEWNGPGAEVGDHGYPDCDRGPRPGDTVFYNEDHFESRDAKAASGGVPPEITDAINAARDAASAAASSANSAASSAAEAKKHAEAAEKAAKSAT